MLKKVFLAVALTAALSTSAQQAAATAGDKTQSSSAELIDVANKLIKYGYQTKTALPLIQAVEIYNRFDIKSGTETKESSTDAVASAGEITKNNPVSYDLATITADAKKYADGDANLLALLNEAQQTRGATIGAIRRNDTVRARTVDTWTIRFRGGEEALVIVSGDGDTDLDLFIYDENDNLITQDADATDDCVVTFTPRWTGDFKVKIKNLGNVYNRYILLTN